MKRKLFSKKRKRLTQIFPFLIPIRMKQRKICFYTKMRFDGRIYAKSISIDDLPYQLFTTHCGLYNKDTGFDMVYQENKVFNLKLATKMLNGLLIKPGETFSLCLAIRYANKYVSYKDGLTVTNGKLTTAKGGGMCQMSNLLFWLFLHTPLTIVERYTHDVKDFPTMKDNEPEGVDATISEGWLDLKVKNETDMTFQIKIDFDNENIFGTIHIDKQLNCTYEVDGKDLRYFSKNNVVFEEISIYRKQISISKQKVISNTFLYKNLCEIGYQLPTDTKIIKIKDD